MLPQPSYTLRNYKIICKVVLLGTYMVVLAIALLLCVSLLSHPSLAAIVLLGICATALIYALIAHLLLIRGRYHMVAYMLIGFYGFLASGIVWRWGVDTPMGILLFGLVIVLGAF